RAERRGSARDRFLSEFALSLTEDPEPLNLLKWSVDSLGPLLGADRLSLWLLQDPGRRRLECRATYCAADIEPLSTDVMSFESLDLLPLRTFEQPVVFSDVSQAPEL